MELQRSQGNCVRRIDSKGLFYRLDGRAPSPPLFNPVASTTSAIASTEAQAMKDIGASGTHDYLVAEGENDLVRLALLAHEPFGPAQLAVLANVLDVLVVNFLNFRL